MSALTGGGWFQRQIADLKGGGGRVWKSKCCCELVRV